jgi:hypothetical protein
MPNLTGKPLTKEERDRLLERWSNAIATTRKSAEKFGLVLTFKAQDLEGASAWELEYILSDKDGNVVTSGSLVELGEFLDRCPKLKAFL